MIKVCFICHGNICRSPMAEYVLKNKVKDLKEEFLIVSKATSTDEIGNDMYYETKRLLNENKIPYDYHQSTQLTKIDYGKYDYFLCMDDKNIENTLKIFGGDKENKVSKLSNGKDIKDPWYTRNFDITYEDVLEGCTALLEQLPV